MLHSKVSPHRVIINGTTYIKASKPMLKSGLESEELFPEISPSLFKVIILGSIVPLLFLYTLAHLIP